VNVGEVAAPVDRDDRGSSPRLRKPSGMWSGSQCDDRGVGELGRENVVGTAARTSIARVVFTSLAASIREGEGTVGNEDSPHRGSYPSVYHQSKHESEYVAFAAAATGMQVALNPSPVQGPRKNGNGAIIIAFLNGRLRALVDTHVSVVDVRPVGDPACAARPAAPGPERRHDRRVAVGRPWQDVADLPRGSAVTSVAVMAWTPAVRGGRRLCRLRWRSCPVGNA
jgi:3-beta hydroxysteroid dehydrogenase/isomerase family